MTAPRLADLLDEFRDMMRRDSKLKRSDCPAFLADRGVRVIDKPSILGIVDRFGGKGVRVEPPRSDNANTPWDRPVNPGITVPLLTDEARHEAASPSGDAPPDGMRVALRAIIANITDCSATMTEENLDVWVRQLRMADALVGVSPAAGPDLAPTAAAKKAAWDQITLMAHSGRGLSPFEDEWITTILRAANEAQFGVARQASPHEEKP